MLVFSRVSTLHINELMEDPELVLGLIDDMGFSIDDEDAPVDSDAMLSILESRWQGHEQNYSLEEFSDLAQHVLLDVCCPTTLDLLFKGGKASSVYTCAGAGDSKSAQGQSLPVCVLSPAEVEKINANFSTVDLIQLQQDWMDMKKVKSIKPDATVEDIDTFWMLFPGIFQFFQHAYQKRECVLRSQI